MSAMIALGVLSMAMNAGGSFAAAAAQKAAGAAAARMHIRQGAQTQRRLNTQATDVIRQSVVAGRSATHQGVTDVGRYRTGFASSGVDVGTGTAAYVQLRGDEIATAEVMVLRENALRQAVEFRKRGAEESELAAMKAKYARQTGNAAAMGSYFEGASSLLRGAASIAGHYEDRED